MRARPIHGLALAPCVLLACLGGPDPRATHDAEESSAGDEHEDSSDASSTCGVGPFAVAYSEAVMLDAGADPRGVTLGDVDGDGHLDILVSAGDEGELRVFHGAGDGSFAEPTISALADGIFPEALQGDAIADGVFDVVARATTATIVLVRMRGDGSGSFGDHQLLQVQGPVFALGPITDDATLDLLVPTQGGSLHVYPGAAADESFTPSPISSSGAWTSPGGVGLGDFDDDGDLDVAIASQDELHIGLSQLEGGAPSFDFAAPLAFFGTPSDLHTGDVDGDGKLEIVLTTFGGGSDAGHVFFGRGDGSFAADQVLDAPAHPVCVDLDDLDEDGRDDVAMVGSDAMVAYLSTGTGFGPGMQVSCAGANPRQLSLGDLDGDCIEDAVTVTDAGVCIMMSHAP
jgi:hypothetical protein